MKKSSPDGDTDAVTALADQMGASTASYEIADPDRHSAPIDRRINRTAEALGALVLASLAAMVFANAVGRYTMSRPLPWTEEAVLSLMPWLTMIGLFLSVRRRQMIRIDTYVGYFPARLRKGVEVATEIVGVVLFGYVAWIGLEYVLMFGGDRTAYFGMRQGWISSALFVGFGLAAIIFVTHLWESLRKREEATDA